MKLKAILKKFKSPSEAALVAGLGRTAGYHWYGDEERQTIPPPRVLIIWADHFDLSDESLGALIRDANDQRDKLIAMRSDIRQMQKDRKRKDAIERHEERKRKASAAQRARMEKKIAKADERIAQSEDARQKEEYLRLKKMQEELQKLNNKLLSIS